MSKGKIITFIAIFLVLGFVMQPPVKGGRLSSWWGIRPSGLGGFLHPGTDIAHTPGTAIYAIASGSVRETGQPLEDPRGNFVRLGHFGIIETRYYHLHDIYVERGQSVNHSSIIGTVGNTGLSTGPHLHFEIRLIGIPLPGYLLTLPGRIVGVFFGQPATRAASPQPAAQESVNLED